MSFRPDLGYQVYIEGYTNVKHTSKTSCQLLFESIRHTIATKHQVPKHLTEDELKVIMNLLKTHEERDYEI